MTALAAHASVVAQGLREHPELMGPPHTPFERAALTFFTLWAEGERFPRLDRFEDADLWVRWSRLIGPFQVESRAEVVAAPWAPPAGDVVLYRGCDPERVTGMSWTPRREIATAYAAFGQAGGPGGAVHSAVFSPGSLLARFGLHVGTPDAVFWCDEWLVDPADIHWVQRLHLTTDEVAADVRRLNGRPVGQVSPA